MGATFVIALREGIEAALIVSIVLAYLKQLGATDRARLVWWGTGFAVALCAVVGTADLRRRRRVRGHGGRGVRRARHARRRRRADVDDLLDAPAGRTDQVGAPGEGRHRDRLRRTRTRGARLLRRPPRRRRDRALPVRRREGHRGRRDGGRAGHAGDRRGPRTRARRRPRSVAVPRRHPHEPPVVLPGHRADLDRRRGGAVRLLPPRAAGGGVAARSSRRTRSTCPRASRTTPGQARSCAAWSATTPTPPGSRSWDGPRTWWWSAGCSSGDPSCHGTKSRPEHETS